MLVWVFVYLLLEYCSHTVPYSFFDRLVESFICERLCENSLEVLGCPQGWFPSQQPFLFFHFYLLHSFLFFLLQMFFLLSVAYVPCLFRHSYLLKWSWKLFIRVLSWCSLISIWCSGRCLEWSVTMCFGGDLRIFRTPHSWSQKIFRGIDFRLQLTSHSLHIVKHVLLLVGLRFWLICNHSWFALEPWWLT